MLTGIKFTAVHFHTAEVASVFFIQKVRLQEVIPGLGGRERLFFFDAVLGQSAEEPHLSRLQREEFVFRFAKFSVSVNRLQIATVGLVNAVRQVKVNDRLSQMDIAFVSKRRKVRSSVVLGDRGHRE